MTNKLHVTNLSASATLASVRQLFNGCGEVADVEFLVERNARPTSAAYVTMTTGAGAQRAVHQLHGARHQDRVLLVSVAAGSSFSSDRKAKEKVADPGARISRQYRDRNGMSCELDSAGVRLTLTFVFPEHEGETWRLRAAVSGQEVAEEEATGRSRELAFTALSERCKASSLSPLAAVQWPEVAAALRSVRAI
jgi:hypothetical protein